MFNLSKNKINKIMAFAIAFTMLFAHSEYTYGGRIYLNEFEDRIILTNPGSFLPGKIEPVLNPGYNPPFYRNQLLAETMVKLNMIDSQSTGILLLKISRSLLGF